MDDKSNLTVSKAPELVCHDQLRTWSQASIFVSAGEAPAKKNEFRFLIVHYDNSWRARATRDWTTASGRL